MAAPAQPFNLQGDLTIYQVAELKPLLQGWLNEGGARLEIDLGQLQTVDCAGVQLLALLQASCQQQGKQLRLLQAPPMLRTLLCRLRLDSHFTLTEGS